MTTNYTAEQVLSRLSQKRRDHMIGVEKTAIKLAKRYGEDPKKAALAAQYHDICRGMEGKILNRYVRKYGLPKKYLNKESLSHGKIAAELMKADYGINDEDVLNAVRYHTTGRAGMSPLEKIIYLADSIEPGRDYPGVERLRKLAKKDLDKAVIFSLELTVGYVKERSMNLDTDTLAALEWLKKRSENE